MLVSPQDFTAISPDFYGLEESQFETAIQTAIDEAEFWLKQYVPTATLEEANNALIANSAEQDQQALWYAQFYYTQYVFKQNIAQSGESAGLESAAIGNVRLRFLAPEVSQKGLSPLLRKAWKFLRVAGYIEGVITSAGVRGGNPLDN